MNPFLRDLQIPGEHVRVDGDGIGYKGHLQIGNQARRRFVVRVHRRVLDHAGGKELLLGFKIPLHGIEVVQMILAQVGVTAHLKFHPVQPVHVDGVGADLHADHLHALVRHNPQGPLQIDGIRRSQLSVHMLLRDHGTRGADQAALHPGLFNDAFQQVGRGGLSFGARNAHHAHLPGRIPVESHGDPAHGRPAVADPHLRHLQFHKALHDQRHASVLHRFPGIVVGIELGAHNAEKQPFLGLVPAAAGDFTDLRFHIPARFQHVGGLRNQFPQFH